MCTKHAFRQPMLKDYWYSTYRLSNLRLVS